MTHNRLILTAAPGSEKLALDELGRTTPLRRPTALAPGIWLVAPDRPFDQIAQGWQHRPPIFPRHICPVQEEIFLFAHTGDLELLADAATDLCRGRLDGAHTFSVQSRILCSLPYRPFDLNRTLSDAVHTALGAHLDVRNPIQVLSVVCATPESASPVAYLGLSLAAQNLSNWAGGEQRFAREAGQISRAEFKLLEALNVFGIRLPPRGIALDLGAAPGGWTRILRRQEQYVTAVDPARLHESLYRDRGVRHRAMTAEAYLADDPDHFDLIVNDMRMDARDSARLMVEYAACLHAEGQVILTLKLPEVDPLPVLEHALAILEPVYTILGVRQLFHNRSEVTVWLRPVPGAAPTPHPEGPHS